MNILLIDKYEVSRKGLSLILQTQYPGSVVTELDNLVPANLNAADFEPELIIIGIGRADTYHDQRLIENVKRVFPGKGVIAYDGHNDHNMLASCLQSGVDGYLTRESQLVDLFGCVNHVINGKKYASGDLLFELVIKNHQSVNRESRKKKLPLTSHEYKVANYLSEGMKTTLIAQNMNRKISTISTIKANIFRKLNVDNIISLKDAMIRNSGGSQGS